MIMQVIRILIFFTFSKIEAFPLDAISPITLSRSSSINSVGSLSPNTYLRSPSPPYSLHASPETTRHGVSPTQFAKRTSKMYAKASIKHAGLAISTGVRHACAGAYGAMKCLGKAGLTKGKIMNKDLSKPERKIKAKDYVHDGKEIFNKGKQQAKQQTHDTIIETGYMIAESISNKKLAKRPEMAKQTYGDKDQNSFKEMKNNLKSFRTESKQKQRNSIRQNSRIGRDGASSSGSQTSGKL